MPGGAWIEGKRGAYVVRWRDGTKNAKGQLIKWKSVDTFVKREQALIELRDRIDALTLQRRARRRAAAAPMATIEIMERFIRDRQADRKLNESTAAEYSETITRLVAETGWKSTLHITRDAVKEFKAKKQGRGVSRPLAYLRSIMNWAEHELGQKLDPAAIAAMSVSSIVTRDEADRPPRVLYTAEQLAACIERADAYGPDQGILARYLAKYGARPRTAARLLVSDYVNRHGEGLLTLRKLKNGRTITHPLDEATVAMFDRLVTGREPGQALFLDLNSQPWTLDRRQKPDTMCKWWSRQIAYDLPRGLQGIYDLKRYAITTMLANGIDLTTICLFTGHKDVRSLMRYMRTNLIVAQNVLAKLPATGIYRPRPVESGG